VTRSSVLGHLLHLTVWHIIFFSLSLDLNAVDLCSGGLWNAILSTIEIGGSAMGLFLRSQRTWNCKPLDDNDAELFKKTLKVL